MNIFCSSRFDEYDNETAQIEITIAPVLGCSIEGYTNIHYVNPYDGNEKDETYVYNYYFDPEEYQSLTDYIKADYLYYFSGQTANADSLVSTVALIIKEQFDFSANMPGGLHRFADSHQIQHVFTMQ